MILSIILIIMIIIIFIIIMIIMLIIIIIEAQHRALDSHKSNLKHRALDPRISEAPKSRSWVFKAYRDWGQLGDRGLSPVTVGLGFGWHCVWSY